MQYNAEQNQIRISLPELINLYCRRGSIGKRKTFVSAKGTDKLKAAICSSLGDACDFDCEMYTHVSFQGIDYYITAVADIVSYEKNTSTIIMPLSVGGEIPDDGFFMPYIASLAALCSVFCSYNGKDLVNASLRIHIRGEEPREISHLYTAAEAESELAEIIKGASVLASYEVERKKTRIPAESRCKFPYQSKRDGQKDFMVAAYTAMYEGKRLFAEAPTGIGKTISALYPAVKALGKGFSDKIFYLTPKTTAQIAALDAAELMADSGKVLRAVILTAKDKLCFDCTGSHSKYPESKCDDCKFGKEHFSRVNSAIEFLLSEKASVRREDILAAARKFSVCPYELSLDFSEYCDLVICDYNYLFDSRAYLRRYFDDERFPSLLTSGVVRSKYTFLIDEAHNLCDRARNMYSDRISKSSVESLRLDITDSGLRTLDSACSDLISDFARFYAACDDNINVGADDKKHGYALLGGLDDAAIGHLFDFAKAYDDIKLRGLVALPQSAVNFYFQIKDFLSKAAYFSERFRCTAEVDGDDVTWRLLCLDPADILSDRLSSGKSAVMFSATLSPSDYYMRMLGNDETAQFLKLPSPYDPDRLAICVMDRISTRYRSRGESLYSISTAINAVVREEKGNYMVFFPSYGYLEEVRKVFATLSPTTDIIVQKRNMTESEKEAFISRFDAENESTLVGFCVLGGAYAESIDLIGKKLIGAVIVGVGLPKLSEERNLLSEYHDSHEENGYMFSYVYPGMTRVMQAAGRVIRSEDDRGVLVLIDERFGTSDYKRIFPEHWHGAKFIGNTDSLGRVIHDFWNAE